MAIQISLKSDNFKVHELDGTFSTIQGAENILSKYKDKKFSNLSEDDIKKIGLALHTVQDCQVHQGTRWDLSIANRIKALKMKMQDNHPNIGCGLADNLEKAQQKTQEYINLIEGEANVKQFKDSLEVERRKQVMQDEDNRKMKTQPKF